MALLCVIGFVVRTGERPYSYGSVGEGQHVRAQRWKNGGTLKEVLTEM